MNVRAHFALAAVVVVWAGSFSAIKALLDDGVAAGDVALWRYAIAAPGFALVLWLAGGLPGLTRPDAVRIAVVGVLVVVGYHLFLNSGTEHTTSGVAALVVALSPAMTLAISVAFGLERLLVRHVLGLAVAFAGVAVVVTLGTGEELSLGSAKGPLVVLGAPLSFALFNVLLKPLLGRYDLVALTAATSLVGMIGLAPLVRGSTVAVVRDGSVHTASLLLYLGVLATSVGYIGWNVGLRRLGPTRAVTYTYGVSPLAVLIGAVVLEEPVTPWIFLGAALVVGGIAIAQGVVRRGFGVTRGQSASSSRSAS